MWLLATLQIRITWENITALQDEKSCVSLVVLLGVGLSNLAKVTQLGPELESVKLQIPSAFHYTVQPHSLVVELD